MRPDHRFGECIKRSAPGGVYNVTMNLIALKHNVFVDRLRLCGDLARIGLSGRKPLVLVHAMPKTGGTTAAYSLKASVSNPVFHVHTWDPEAAVGAISRFAKKRGGAPYSFRQGQMLRRMMETKAKEDWKIITLVREPVVRMVSLFFQTGKAMNDQFVDGAGKYKANDVVRHLYNRISGAANRNPSREEEWFYREICQPVGIDVFEHDFDCESGYMTVQRDRFGLLVLRLEDMNERFSEATTAFLDLPTPVTLERKNAAAEKSYKSAYREVCAQLRFPRETLRRLYSTQFVQHFYSSDMINQFISKWACEGSWR